MEAVLAAYGLVPELPLVVELFARYVLGESIVRPGVLRCLRLEVRCPVYIELRSAVYGIR